ncbi:helix-turn-helix domain-containing protein [Salmonella enterica subsp. enterica serovar Enteritidis]|nr:helix-turn-helix domain-containing protein [Salmonella enterica subsp. enterica serovar Enteritidis]ELP2195198.1 helix-turn-helix domain-containing protein [Salmonella enterica subsp. enterica serovar Champaign]
MSTKVTRISCNLNYMKSTISERIRSRRKELKLTQDNIAKALGVTRVSVTKWEAGQTKPDGENLHLLAKVLLQSPEWILYGKDSQDKSDDDLHLTLIASQSNITKLPVLTWEQAGNWDMTYPVTDTPGINRWADVMTKQKNDSFLLEVKGDAMTNPNGVPTIPDGSTVLITPCTQNIEELDGRIVLIQMKGKGNVTLKKVAIDGPNIYLQSLNPSYKNIELQGEYLIKGRVSQIHQYLD